MPPIAGLLRHRLFKNTASLLVVQVSSYVAPLVILPYLSRILTTEHLGLIQFATAFNWYFMTLVEYGFNLTATRRIAIHRDDPDKVSEIFSSVMAAKALLTVVGFALMMAIVLAVPGLRVNAGLFAVTYLLVLGDLLFPIWLFQGLERMGNLVWRDVGAKMLSLMFIFAVVHSDGDYFWAAAFQAGSAFVAGVVGLVTVFVTTPVRWVRPSLRECLTDLREGWPVFVSMLAAQLTGSTNILIVGFRGGASGVAFYTAVYRLVVAVRALVTPAVTALYPHISHMAHNSRETAVRFLRRYAVLLAAPFFAASLVLLFGAPLIIRILYGSKYLASIPLLKVLAFSPCLLALQHIFSTFFMLAFGYHKQWSRFTIQGTILNYLILVPLVYLIWPPMGAAVTGIVIEVFMAVVTYVFYRRHVTEVPVAVAA